MRDVVVRAADAADGEVAQAALDAWAARRLATYEDAERGLCFGRLDFETFESPALRRAALGARRGRRPSRRELAGARRSSVLHRDPDRSTGRDAPPSLPGERADAPRHRGRDARRLDARRRPRQRLPARGARAEPGRADARHRRDDPGRPVPADHVSARQPSRDPGRPRDGQDRGRAPPRLVAPLHGARAKRAEPRPGRGAEPHLHGVRLARPSRARRGRRRAACGLGARRRRRADLERAGRRRTAEGRRPDGRRDLPRRRDPPPRRARRAAAPPRRGVRPCPRPRPGAAPRRGARGARHDGRCARALPDGSRAELLRRVRPPPRGRRDARRGAGRAGAPVERRAPPRPRSRLARRRPGPARPGAVHDTRLPGRGGRGGPRRPRAAAPATPRCRVGRGGRRTARRGARARRRACARVRPRHRRRGPGPLADAAADDRAGVRRGAG